MARQRHLHIADPVPVQRREKRLEPVAMLIDDGEIRQVAGQEGLRDRAPVVELVDAPDSKSGSERSAGSTPARGTTPANVIWR